MNRVKLSNLYLGFLLIAAGVVLLAINIGFEPDLDESTTAAILAGASGLILIGYLIGDWGRWWLLLPAAALAAGSMAIYLDNREIDDELIGGLSAALMAVPFWAAFLVDRSKNKWALIPAPLLTLVGIGLIIMPADGSLFSSLLMLAIAAVFFGVFVFDRKQWWALIPAYTLTVIALIILFADKIPDELMAAFIMWSIALPFLVVYSINRQNWWALIPAYVLIIIGLITLVAAGDDSDFIASFVMITIALPFFVVYLRNREHWWALIPAGVLTSIGLAVFFVIFDLSDAALERIVGGIILAGIAATFAIIWAQRKLTNADWAIYPAAACALGAALVLILGIRMELLWGFALIIAGGWILVRNRPKTKA